MHPPAAVDKVLPIDAVVAAAEEVIPELSDRGAPEGSNVVAQLKASAVASQKAMQTEAGKTISERPQDFLSALLAEVERQKPPQASSMVAGRMSLDSHAPSPSEVLERSAS